MSKSLADNIIYVITNIFRIYCFYRFACFWFKKKEDYSRFAEYLAYIGYFTVNTVCHLIFHYPPINMITNILPFFLITYLYSSKNYIRILTTLMIYAVCMIIDGIVYAFAKLINIDSIVITSGIASTIMLLCVELLIERFVQYRKHQKITFKYILTIIIVPVGSIIIGIFSMQPEQFDINPFSITVECLILLVMNAMVFIIYDMTGKVYEQQRIHIILENQNKAYANQIRLMERSQEQIRFLKHDLKNHLLKIRILAQYGEFDKIIKYTDEAEKYILIPEKYIESGNTGIDSILNLKLYEADMHGIKFQTEISVPNELNITDFDINIILGNLLDNSINALENSIEKKLYIKIKYEAGVLYIVIKNNFTEKKQRNYDKSEHGLGLHSIENTINKYSGIAKYSQKKNVFTASLMLYL